MKIEYLQLTDLKPYKNNPRINDDAVEAVKNSIQDFGFRNPILIDKNNEIVAGHTRAKAASKLGLTEVPTIRIEDLTEEQIKAFRIADNSSAELSSWDLKKLEIELEDISFDMEDFGLKFDFSEEKKEDDGYYGDERLRTSRSYNLDYVGYDSLTKDFWQMPIIYNEAHIPRDLIGFNYAKTSKDYFAGIHFYIDDYQFERIWNKPEDYTNILIQYDCILSPDFSLYMEMPMPMKIWNIYRSRLIGSYYQQRGITVIPTLSWAERETFDFCFKGIEKGSVVSVSTIGVKKSPEALKTWAEGMDEAIRQIEPKALLLYGGEIEYNYQGIPVYYYENHVVKNWGE